MLNFYQKLSGRSLEIGRPAGSLLLAIATAWTLGCGPEVEWQLAEDLTATLEIAEVDREQLELDVGTPEARPFLASGWSWDAWAGDGTSYVWAVGERSEVEIFVAVERRLEIRIRCLAYTFAGSPTQEVELRLDDQSVGSVELGAGFTEHTLPKTAEPVAPGFRRLSFHPTYAQAPSGVSDSADDRPLSFACDGIRLGDGPPIEAPRASDDLLWLPVGTQVSYFLEPDGPRRLAWESLADRDVSGRLAVSWQIEGEPMFEAELEPSGPGYLMLPTPEGETRPARLTLRPMVEGAPTGGLALRRPRLMKEPAPSPVEPTDEPVVASPSIGRPPVLVWVVDTLRTDRLGVYGFDRPTSPHFDALAERSTVFEHAVAQSSWTRPTMATLLTGVGPERHGIRGVDHGLSPSFETLPELLSEAGYVTAGFSANGNFSPDTQLDQGFEHFEYLVSDVDTVADHAVRWLDGLEADDRPQFLMMLTTEPHASFEPKGQFREQFAGDIDDPWIGTSEHIRALGDKKTPATDEVVDQLFRLYDGEIAWNDSVFGRFRNQLSKRGLDPLIVIIADHGEAFRERGVFGHGWDLHREVLQVPFWIHLPGQKESRRISDPVQQADLMPTLLDLLGLPSPQGLDGSSLDGNSLAPYLLGSPAPDLADRPLVATMDYEGRSGATIIRGRYKLIEPLSPDFAPGRRLYDYVADPEELHDLSEERPILAGRLARLLKEALASSEGESADRIELDPETRKQLEALGYIDN